MGSKLHADLNHFKVMTHTKVGWVPCRGLGCKAPLNTDKVEDGNVECWHNIWVMSSAVLASNHYLPRQQKLSPWIPLKMLNNKNISGNCWLLLQVHQEFCSHSKAIDSPYPSWCKVCLDIKPSHSIQHAQSALLESSILHHSDPYKHIVYMDASNDACGAQLSQEHDGRELTVAFLSHTFTDTQWKWRTMEQKTYGIYCAVPKWNYYLQGSDIIAHNHHKPLQKFLKDKNANMVKRWSLELATSNIIFEWISGARNKAADCLSQLVDVKNIPATSTALINMSVISTPDGPATHTHSKHITLLTPPLKILHIHQLMTK